MKKIIFVFYLFFFINGIAQNIPIGTWRSHAAYNNVATIALSPEKIYAGSSGGLFYFDKQYNNAAPITRLDGLSDTDVKKISFDLGSQTLIIIYSNGNIDLLKNNKVKNLDLVYQSGSIQNKNINQITIFNGYAYLSFDFGMVVLDIVRQEIKETWLNLGPGGAKISISGSTFVGDSVFLATSNGILKSPQKNNLQDFNSWSISNNGLPAGLPTNAIASDGTNIFAGIENKGIYAYAGGRWTKLILPDSIASINGLEISNKQQIISLPQKILIRNINGAINKIQNNLLPAPEQALWDDDGKLWIADGQNGLFTLTDNVLQGILPNGPYRREVFKLYNYNENIVALSGGYNGNGYALNDSSGFYVFTNAGWENYNKTNSTINIPSATDLTAVTYNPRDKNLYLGSYGNGVFVKNQTGAIATFAPNNSPLPGNAKITALSTDADGNIWLNDAGAIFGAPSLYEYQGNQTWKSYIFSNPYSLFTTDIIIDQNNFKWMPILPSQGSGLWVYDDKKKRGRLLGKNPGEGNLPTSSVYSIAMDLDGSIWVGTDKGVGVFYNTSQIFEKTNSDAFQPVFDKRPLLREETVTAIAIDGGNRKWMGTKNGLWLFNADGNQLISHFNTGNSPMPSNVIVDMAIQPLTGEIFITTDKGMVSYRGTATAAEAGNGNVKIFPNPVRPGYDGLIAISGLASNAILKITDVSGRLVYQTRANGGTAVWDKKDYKGRNVYSGVYIIFSSTADGNEGYVGKIAVID